MEKCHGRLDALATIGIWIALGIGLAAGGPALAQPPLKTETLTSLNEQQAQILVQGKRSLTMPALRELTPPVAAILATNKGNLKLDAITKLSPETAQALAGCQTAIDLWGLASIDPKAAEFLARSRARLSFEGLATLDSVPLAMKLATQGTPVNLPRLKQVSKEVAAVLAKSKGDLMLPSLEVLDNPGLAKRLATRAPASGPLSLDALKALPAEAAKGFERTSCTITMGQITALDDDTAKAFSTHQGTLAFDSLEKIGPKGLVFLLGNRGPLDLPSLKTLGDPPPPEVLRAIEKHAFPLSLNLPTISPEVAEAFKKRTAMVELYGIETLTPELAELLVNCRSYIWLTQVGEMDETTAEVLLKHRGSNSGFVFAADLAARLPANSARAFEKHKGIHFGTVSGK